VLLLPMVWFLYLEINNRCFFKARKTELIIIISNKYVALFFWCTSIILIDTEQVYLMQNENQTGAVACFNKYL
jgi:hypothetical protein